MTAAAMEDHRSRSTSSAPTSQREERLVGLRPDGHVTPVEIQRRRLQIVLVMLLVFVGLAVTTIANDVWNDLRNQDLWFDPETIRIAMIVFAAGFAVYVLEKEHHLKRLSASSAVGPRSSTSSSPSGCSCRRSSPSRPRRVDARRSTSSRCSRRSSTRAIGSSGRRSPRSRLLTDGGHLEEAWTRGASVTAGRRLVAESVLAPGRGRPRALPARRPAALRADGPPARAGRRRVGGVHPARARRRRCSGC